MASVSGKVTSGPAAAVLCAYRDRSARGRESYRQTGARCLLLMLKAWRIVKEKHASTAFTEEGARLFGGRWNSPGTSVVYTAESQSLAVLEMLVHLDLPELLKRYVLFEITFSEELVSSLERSTLPQNWRGDPVPSEVQLMGDAWAAGQSSAIFKVPSALVPDESNYLLNPLHSEFKRIRIGAAVSFQFDTRLARPRRR